MYANTFGAGWLNSAHANTAQRFNRVKPSCRTGHNGLLTIRTTLSALLQAADRKTGGLVMDTKRKSSSGQATVEFAIAAFLLVFIASFLLEFAPVLLANLRLQSEARLDAGIASLSDIESAPESSIVSQYPSSAPNSRLVPGFALKPFMFTLFLGGEVLVQEEGKVHEEIHLPPIGGFNPSGGVQ
jgi:hypothetical protein